MVWRISARLECERAKRGQLGSGARRPPLTVLGATLNAGAPRMSGSYQECRSDFRSGSRYEQIAIYLHWQMRPGVIWLLSFNSDALRHRLGFTGIFSLVLSKVQFIVKSLCVCFVLFLFFIIYLRTHTYEHKLKLLVFLYKGPTKNDTLLQSSYAAADSLLVEVRKMRLKP